MIPRLLLALKEHLTKETAHLHLVSPEKDAQGQEAVRAPRIYIGDFPAKRISGQEVREFPCVLLVPVAGYAKEGQEFADIAAILGVYNPEKGDAEGAEMDLFILQNAVSKALRRCLANPLEQRFLLERDESDRVYTWQRSGDPDQPRPYAQTTLLSRWSSPGWE